MKVVGPRYGRASGYRSRRWGTAEGRVEACLIRDQRRGGQDRFLIGGLRLLADGRVALVAVAGNHVDVCRPVQFTDRPAWWAFWRTRQAATQFRDRHGLGERWHVYDRRWADVLTIDVDLVESPPL